MPVRSHKRVLSPRLCDFSLFARLDNIRTHYSRPRNETIARVLFNLGYVNTLGSGIPRMIRLMQGQTGRAPDFEVSSAQFLVRLWSRYWQTFQPNHREESKK